MKITMLGTTGSGKTVYMSAMSELFYNDSVDGYAFSTRDDGDEGETNAFRVMKQINTFTVDGSFPAGTSSSEILQLVLKYHQEKILDIDWIDYRGGAIDELASGNSEAENDVIFATLLASDVILVFVDAAVLKLCRNDMTARALVGANAISQLLTRVSRKKHVDIIFLLSKADSSIIDRERDIPELKSRVGVIYRRFLTETNSSIANYPVIPIGAVGYGNVETTHVWREKENGGKALSIHHRVTNILDRYTVNVASSFAKALLLCLDSETQHRTIEASELERELRSLEAELGTFSNIIDILFRGSRRRERRFDLRNRILEDKSAVLRLQPHRASLERIANGTR